MGFIKKIISEKSFGNIYNLGGNENVSIINLAKKIKKLSKSKSKIIFKNYKYSYSNKGKFQDDYEDILKRHPDTSLIKKKFKFKPKYYAGGDNMLGLIAQSPPGTYDIILKI